MKNGIYVDDANEALVITKAFHKMACMYGSAEYYALRKAKAENKDYKVVFKCDMAKKATYNGLTFKRMAAYIETQPDSETRMAEFEAVQRIAEIKGGKYPLTKKWFLTTYPNFKESVVKTDEMTTLAKAANEVTHTDNKKLNAAETLSLTPAA